MLIRGRFSVLGFQHDFPQRLIDSRLVAGPVLLEPGQHVGVNAECDGLLDRPVQTADLRNQIMRTLPLGGRSLQRIDLPPFGNSLSLYHLQLYVYNCPYKFASTKCSTWNTSPMQPVASQLT